MVSHNQLQILWGCAPWLGMGTLFSARRSRRGSGGGCLTLLSLHWNDLWSTNKASFVEIQWI